MSTSLTITKITVPTQILKVMINKGLPYPIASATDGVFTGTLRSNGNIIITETNQYGEVSYPMLTNANKPAWDAISKALKAI